jgi:hypothetical protein
MQKTLGAFEQIRNNGEGKKEPEKDVEKIFSV